MSDIEFARGFYWNDPSEKARSFVIGKISLNKEQFLGWLEAQEPNEKGYVRIEVKRSKDGEKVYASLDTWQPDRAGGSQGRAGSQPYTSGRAVQEEAPFNDDVPW